MVVKGADDEMLEARKKLIPLWGVFRERAK